MEGNFVMIVSALSSFIAVLIAVFSLCIAPKNAVKHASAIEVAADKAISEKELAAILDALKKGERVAIVAPNVSQMQSPNLSYKYSDVTLKKLATS